MEAQVDPGPQYRFYPELGHEISREIPIYLDPEERLEAFVNIFRFSSGRTEVFFHIRMFQRMKPSMYKQFKAAIPAIERQLSRLGKPIYTFFDVDSDEQGKFATKLGWTLLGEIDMYDRRRRIYMYDKHLRKDR